MKPDNKIAYHFPAKINAISKIMKAIVSIEKPTFFLEKGGPFCEQKLANILSTYHVLIQRVAMLRIRSDNQLGQYEYLNCNNLLDNKFMQS